MATIADAISRQQGFYEWGVRDCLTTVRAICEASFRPVPDYAEWHALTELKAIARAIGRYGSLRDAHLAVFQDAGLRIFPKTRGISFVPGDILILCDGVYDKRDVLVEFGKNMAHLGFVAENHEVWTWYDHSLGTVRSATIGGMAR